MASKTSVDRFTIIIFLQVAFIMILIYNQVIQNNQSIYLSASGVIAQENQASSQGKCLKNVLWKFKPKLFFFFKLFKDGSFTSLRLKNP